MPDGSVIIISLLLIKILLMPDGSVIIISLLLIKILLMSLPTS